MPFNPQLELVKVCVWRFLIYLLQYISISMDSMRRLMTTTYNNDPKTQHVILNTDYFPRNQRFLQVVLILSEQNLEYKDLLGHL